MYLGSPMEESRPAKGHGVRKTEAKPKKDVCRDFSPNELSHHLAS